MSSANRRNLPDDATKATPPPQSQQSIAVGYTRDDSASALQLESTGATFANGSTERPVRYLPNRPCAHPHEMYEPLLPAIPMKLRHKTFGASYTCAISHADGDEEKEAITRKYEDLGYYTPE